MTVVCSCSLGFIGAYRNRLNLLQLFIGSLCVIILLQFIAAIVGFTLRNKADDQLRKRLLSTLPAYKGGNLDVITEWDRLQRRWSCCGVDNSSDWTKGSLMQFPPNSCCLNADCVEEPKANNGTYFADGCYGSARSLFVRYSKALGGVSLFFFFVELVGLALAILLLRDLKKNYGSV
jgi:CD63 antigen